MGRLESMYRDMYRSESRRYLLGGEKKEEPVKNVPKTLYPNILAEIEASRYFPCTVIEHAQVDQEIMWAVLEDGEHLTGWEMYRLARLFSCRDDYLKAPTLQVIDAGSNKGKIRRVMLGLRLEAIPPVPGEDWHITNFRGRAAAVFDAMKNGNTVTYAAWRWAMQRCADVLSWQTWDAHKPRAERLSA